MITALIWCLIAVFGFVFFYLFVLSLLGLTVKRRTDVKASSRLRKFAMVVPAHDEETTIERTLTSLREIAYPHDLADIVVVADNCSDRTAAVAAAQPGVTVLERRDQAKRGKGFALQWCFEKILADPKVYDAVVVIDADSVVDRNFLIVMNRYLQDGSTVLQAADVPEARPEVWSSEVVRIGMTLYNISRLLGRRTLNFTAGLRGNGMCFAADILRRVPWRAYSLTEDLEYGLRLLLEGITVTFVPETSVLTVLPSQLSGTQRERWESGRFSVVKTYAPELLREFTRTLSPRILDSLVDLLIPPFVNLFFLAILMALVATGTFFVGWSDESVLWGWGIVLALGTGHVVLGLIAARADRHLFRALAYVPRYAVWKLSVYLNMLMYGVRKEWIRTMRE